MRYPGYEPPTEQIPIYDIVQQNRQIVNSFSLVILLKLLTINFMPFLLDKAEIM